MRKLALIVNIFVILFCFNSCVGADALSEIAIVQSIGIDLLEDNSIGLTLQIYSPQGAGSNTAIDASKNNSSIIKTKGDSLSNAIQNATTLQGKNIFTGNNRIVVVGSDFAKEGLQEMFSYFNRSALTRQNTQVLMSKTKASDIVGVNIYQGILAAETIEEMVNNNKENGIVYQCPYYWLTKNMTLNKGDGAMPIIKLEKDGNDNEKNSSSEEIQTINKVKIEGTAIFNDFKLVDSIGYYDTRGVLLLNNKLEETLINIKQKDVGIVSVRVYKCNTKLRPDISDDNLKFNLEVEMKTTLKELLFPQGKEVTKDMVEEIEQACERKIENEIKGAFHNIVNNSKCDIFDLKDLVLKYEKDFYKSNINNIRDIIFNSDIDVDINIQIDRMGLESDEKIR